MLALRSSWPLHFPPQLGSLPGGRLPRHAYGPHRFAVASYRGSTPTAPTRLLNRLLGVVGRDSPGQWLALRSRCSWRSACAAQALTLALLLVLVLLVALALLLALVLAQALTLAQELTLTLALLLAQALTLTLALLLTQALTLLLALVLALTLTLAAGAHAGTAAGAHAGASAATGACAAGMRCYWRVLALRYTEAHDSPNASAHGRAHNPFLLGDDGQGPLRAPSRPRGRCRSRRCGPVETSWDDSTRLVLALAIARCQHPRQRRDPLALPAYHMFAHRLATCVVVHGHV